MPLKVSVTGTGRLTIPADGTITASRPFVPTRSGDQVEIAFPSTGVVGGASIVNGVMINSSFDTGRPVGRVIRMNGAGAVGLNIGSQVINSGMVVNTFSFGRSGLESFTSDGSVLTARKKDPASRSKAGKSSPKKTATVVLEEEEEDGVRAYDLDGPVGTLRVSGCGNVAFEITEASTEIDCSGTADVDATTALDTLDDLTVRVSGTGDVRLDMNIKRFTANVSGTGDVGNPRVTERARCDVGGTGDVRLRLAEGAGLDRRLTGMGTVRCTPCK